MKEKIKNFTSDAKGSAAEKAFLYAKGKIKSKRDDWFEINITIMLTAIRAKFLQNKDLQQKLLSTGDKILIEDSPKDGFYGRGKNANDYTGENQLGRILMHVRDELRQKKTLSYDPKTTYALSTLK